jgi:hypothetical protein
LPGRARECRLFEYVAASFDARRQTNEEVEVRVAIIGSGNVGKALAGSLVRAGHGVTLSASNPEHARDAATQTGGQAAESNRAAVASAEAVVLAVPYPAVDGVLAEVGDALAGKLLIDATNRVDPADPGRVLDGTSAAEQIQARVPAARVVKAFNTALAARQADPVVEGLPWTPSSPATTSRPSGRRWNWWARSGFGPSTPARWSWAVRGDGAAQHHPAAAQ